jgi:hypothetical protein
VFKTGAVLSPIPFLLEPAASMGLLIAAGFIDPDTITSAIPLSVRLIVLGATIFKAGAVVAPIAPLILAPLAARALFQALRVCRV